MADKDRIRINVRFKYVTTSVACDTNYVPLPVTHVVKHFADMKLFSRRLFGPASLSFCYEIKIHAIRFSEILVSNCATIRSCPKLL
jgi:hypothetical protein